MREMVLMEMGGASGAMKGSRGVEGCGEKRVSRFEDLPDAFLEDVLKACSGKSIAVMQAVNRRLHLLGSLNTVWRESIWNHHGFLLPHRYTSSWHTLQCIHRELAEESNDDTRLQFRGFLTDGGMQDDDTSFWVDNMFHHDISAFYTSSTMSSHGVRCIGLYRPKMKPPTKRAVKCTKIAAPVGTGKKCATSLASQGLVHADLAMSSLQHSESDTKRVVLVRKIQVCKSGGLFFRPVNRGIVLLGNEFAAHSEYGMQNSEYLAHGLYLQTVSPLHNTMNGFVNLASILVACQSGTINVPVRVGIETGAGGVGEWVEFGESMTSSGAMKPVVWFRMYSRDECIGGWTKERQIQAHTLKAKFTALGASFMMVNVDGINIKRSSGMLNMPLLHPVVGDAVCTLLSSSESVMPDVIEIPNESNYVEINYVWLLGKEIKINMESTVKSVQD